MRTSLRALPPAQTALRPRSGGRRRRARHGNPDLPAQLGVAVGKDETQQVVHLFGEMRSVFDRQNRVRRLQVVGEQKACACTGSVDRVAPALEVRASSFFDEPEEVTSQSVHRGRLENRLDRRRDRRDELFDGRAQRQTRVANGECGEKNIFEPTRRRYEHLNEVFLAVAREVPARDERELRSTTTLEGGTSDAGRRRHPGHHLDETCVRRVGVERRGVHSEDLRGPVEAAHGLNRGFGRVLPRRRIELHKLLVATHRREPSDQDRRNHDGEDLADDRLFFRVRDEATPRFLRDRSRRSNERRLLVRDVDFLLLLVREPQVREHGRDTPLAVDVSVLLGKAKQRMERGVVARIVAHAACEFGRVFVGCTAPMRVRRRVIRDVHLDADLGTGFLELVFESYDACLERLDASLERHGARVGRRLERHHGRGRRRVVHRKVLDDDSVASLVRGLERLLEPTQARAIEAEVVRHPVELAALLLGDDAVANHLRKQLFVHRLELTEAHVSRDLASLESSAVVERSVVHEVPLPPGSVAWVDAAHKAPKLGRLTRSMMESVDDLETLFARWQKNPDLAQTVALCEILRGAKRVDLVAVVGLHASRQKSVPALTAAARMYADTGSLEDAQRTLLVAGRLSPRDGSIYRMLGEVLLRRGDAERAEKVFERALECGTDDATTGAWLERARALGEAQRTSGMMAVADAIDRELNPRTYASSRVEVEVEEGEPDDAATQVRRGAALPAAATPAPAPIARPQVQALPLDPIAVDEAFSRAFDAPSARLDGSEPTSTQTATVALPPAMPGAEAAAPSSGSAFARYGSTDDVPTSPTPFLPQPPAAPERGAAAPLAQPAGISNAANPVPVGQRFVGKAMPEARDVLDALQIAGIFEPDGSVRPQPLQWDKAAKGPRRIGSYVWLLVLAIAMVGGAAGTYRYVGDTRARQHIEAEALLVQIDANLRASEQQNLEASERTIARAFELESRSPHAALTWLHERAMVGLLKGGETIAFEDGAARAREVRVEEARLAFTHVASFLFQGDTAGAAAALAKWDGKADDDPWYALIAGATLERAGDPRALERYAAAVKLDPDLVIARVLLARATAIDGDPVRAAELAAEFRAKYPNRLEGAALSTLAWARDPLRGEMPLEARDIADKDDALPVPLKAVAPAARGLLAAQSHKADEASAALKRGLAAADTPGVAAWLGSMALTIGELALARKAALTAVSYSAGYPPARMLAARVALLGARLDEALKACEELSPTSTDVAVVTAAVAYEKLDGERMSRALDSLPNDANKLPLLAALVRGQALLKGDARAIDGDRTRVLAVASSESPWADLVAMDGALDTGDLDVARAIAARWTTEPTSMRAVRLARLARWDGKLDDAERLSHLALAGGTVTVRALAERVFVLVARGKSAEAVALFRDHPNVGGPLAKWLRAYAVASSGKLDEARAMVAQEDPPPALAPLPARMYAAATYGSVKDTRKGGPYVKALVQAGFGNPDVVPAAAAKPGRRQR